MPRDGTAQESPGCRPWADSHPSGRLLPSEDGQRRRQGGTGTGVGRGRREGMGGRKNIWSKREKGRQTERLRMYSAKERGADRQGDTQRQTKLSRLGRGRGADK